MTAPRRSLLRAGLGLISVSFVLQQIVLGLLVFGLCVLWLRIPDSSVGSVIATILLGLMIVIVAGGGESWMFLKLAGSVPTRTKVLRGALILFIALVVWFGWTALIERLSVGNELRAGYLNSKAPHSLREFFSYPHLTKWFGWASSLLQSVGSGVLTSIAFSLVASSRPRLAIKSALRSITFWIVFLLVTLFVAPGIYAITQWTPGHGVRVELLSLVLRLGAAVLLGGITVSIVLTILAASIRGDASYESPAGTPDDSHPLTAETP